MLQSTQYITFHTLCIKFTVSLCNPRNAASQNMQTESYCLGSSFPSGSRQNGVTLDDLLEVTEPDISESFLLSRSLHLTSRLLQMIGGSKDIEGWSPWDSESYLPRSLPRPLTLWLSLVCWAELSREALYGKLVMGRASRIIFSSPSYGVIGWSGKGFLPLFGKSCFRVEELAKCFEVKLIAICWQTLLL